MGSEWVLWVWWVYAGDGWVVSGSLDNRTFRKCRVFIVNNVNEGMVRLFRFSVGFGWVWWVSVGDGWVVSGSLDNGRHELSKNICFVQSKTSYSRDKWRCYRCRTNNDQGKIKTISLWYVISWASPNFLLGPSETKNTLLEIPGNAKMVWKRANPDKYFAKNFRLLSVFCGHHGVINEYQKACFGAYSVPMSPWRIPKGPESAWEDIISMISNQSECFVMFRTFLGCRRALRSSSPSLGLF